MRSFDLDVTESERFGETVLSFVDPDGLRLELATDAPGFPDDELVETLGSDLKLPPWLEPEREQIEAQLPKARAPRKQVMSGHETQPVSQAGTPLTGASAALILSHGRGATAESMLPLADAVGAAEFAVLAPQARGYQWYPQRFTAPREQNEPSLTSALRTVEKLVKQASEAGIPTERVVSGGFSQGACLASEFAAQHPTRYGGLLVFSGGLIGESVSAEAYDGSLVGTPVFVGCSDVDPHIPLKRVQETTRIFEALEADVTEKIYPGMAHTVIEDELEQARTIIAGVTR